MESNFEFLLTFDEEPFIKIEDFDNVMTPDSFHWSKIIKDDWVYYRVGEDEFSYSFEIVGIQMVFNEDANFEKAKKIANEVVEKLINYSGQSIHLEIITGDYPISLG
jgi:hypothetical protein